PDYFWWVTPIIAALLLSVPTSVYSSRVSLGDRARRLGLFLTEEETSPPQELRDLWENERIAAEASAKLPPEQRDGFMRALIDPYVNALHRALLRRPRKLRPSIREAREQLAERLLRDGVSALSPREQRIVFHDPDLVDRL